MNSKLAICRVLMLASIVIFLVSPSVSAESGKTVKVFFLGGQSNMLGKGGKTTDLPFYYKYPLPTVQIWGVKTKQWKPLSPEGRSFGPELSFGHAISKAFPNDDIRLVKYAANGTALYNDWAPTKGAQYVSFMGTVMNALGDLRSNNIEFEIAGMLWLQGESDAQEKKGEDYKKNLLAFIKRMRTEFDKSKMPFVIARVRDFYGKGAQAQMVRDAQVEVADKTESVSWFDTDDCGQLIKGGHYTSAGLIKIGKKFAEQFDDMINTTKKNDCEDAFRHCEG